MSLERLDAILAQNGFQQKTLRMGRKLVAEAKKKKGKRDNERLPYEENGARIEFEDTQPRAMWLLFDNNGVQIEHGVITDPEVLHALCTNPGGCINNYNPNCVNYCVGG